MVCMNIEHYMLTDTAVSLAAAAFVVALRLMFQGRATQKLNRLSITSWMIDPSMVYKNDNF